MNFGQLRFRSVDAIVHADLLHCGDIVTDPLFGERIVTSVFFQNGEWHFTTSVRQHEPA